MITAWFKTENVLITSNKGSPIRELSVRKEDLRFDLRDMEN